MTMNDVVLQTVKRMISSGVDDNTIKMTLQGINIPENEIQAVINEAKGIKPSENQMPEDSSQNVSGEDDDSFEEDAEDYDEDEDVPPEPSVRKEAEAISQEQVAQHTTTHQYLEEHGQKLDGVKKDVLDIQAKVDASPKISPATIAKIDALDKRMSGIEKEIGETKANTIALQDLLKKILETNKKTLLKLK